MENVGGSEALVWNSSEEISRASRNAAASPIAFARFQPGEAFAFC